MSLLQVARLRCVPPALRTMVAFVEPKPRVTNPNQRLPNQGLWLIEAAEACVVASGATIAVSNIPTRESLVAI